MTSDSSNNFGTAFFQLDELRLVSKLWEGPLHPAMLEPIELTLRGLITSKKLSTLRLGDHLHMPSNDMDWRQPYFKEYFTPFEDHLLDYEFVDPETLFLIKPLEEEEDCFLTNQISMQLFDELKESTSKLKLTKWEADRYIERWYKGGSPQECLLFAQNYAPLDFNNSVESLAAVGDDYPTTEFDCYSHPSQLVNFSHLMNQIRYYVATHRSGYQVYSRDKISSLCNEHLFSLWPNKIFDDVSLNYKELARELRGPGVGIDFPLITAIVLSRAESREQIPRVIVDIREEYEKSRKQLWSLLDEMWLEKSFTQQQNILAELKGAAESIFPSAFPEKFDALSLSLDFARLSVSGVAGGFKELRKRDLPNVRVSAVSFAKQLSYELRNNLQNTRTLLKRHLSEAEKRDFGIL